MMDDNDRTTAAVLCGLIAILLMPVLILAMPFIMAAIGPYMLYMRGFEKLFVINIVLIVVTVAAYLITLIRNHFKDWKEYAFAYYIPIFVISIITYIMCTDDLYNHTAVMIVTPILLVVGYVLVLLFCWVSGPD